MDDQEKTQSGELIYRYDPSKSREFEFAIGNEQSIEEITMHIEKHVGKVEAVFHEIISSIVHIDIHWVKPTSNFSFHTLVTSGMSDKPMAVPGDCEESKYAELCILLPPDWRIQDDTNNVPEEEFNDEINYWPMRWLKFIARFPHEYDTWLGWGHTIPNGENAEPFAGNTKLGCMLLMPSVILPLEFYELQISETKTIRFFCLYPLYKEEMNYKIQKGVEALFERFDKYKIRNVVDINRPNTCLKKGLFGLW